MPTVEYLNYAVLDDQGWSIDDDNLFEKAREAGLPDEDHGTFEVQKGEYILDAAEADGHGWPFSCRNGLCSNCAAILKEGTIEMDGNQVLTNKEVEDRDVRLTCVGRAASERIALIYNAKQLDYLQDRVMY